MAKKKAGKKAVKSKIATSKKNKRPAIKIKDAAQAVASPENEVQNQTRIEHAEQTKEYKGSVIVFGSSQLAITVKERLLDKDYHVEWISTEEIKDIEKTQTHSKFESIKNRLKRCDMTKVKAICILDEKDSRNIELTLAVLSQSKEVPIHVALLNESLSRYFSKNHANLNIFDPVSISAPTFLEAFEKAKQNKGEKAASMDYADTRRKRLDKSLITISSILAILFLGSLAFFHYQEHLTWIDSLYFTTTTLTTVGYGDINLLNSSLMTKLFAVSVILAFYFNMWIFFSLIVDYFMKRRYEEGLGQKKHRLKKHIIICGIGKTSQQIAEHFLRKRKKVLGIELNRENKFINILKSEGVDFMVGDAALPENLVDAGIEHASGIFVMINNDLKGLEVSLNAISLRPDIPIVVRLIDDELAEKIREELNIPYALSITSIASDYLMKKIDGE